jgi:hypothetical protein
MPKNVCSSTKHIRHWRSQWRHRTKVTFCSGVGNSSFSLPIRFVRIKVAQDTAIPVSNALKRIALNGTSSRPSSPSTFSFTASPVLPEQLSLQLSLHPPPQAQWPSITDCACNSHLRSCNLFFQSRIHCQYQLDLFSEV